MKLIKWLLWLLLFLVVILVGGMVFIANNVDPNSFKSTLSEQVKKQTGRDLSLNGDLSWRFYPWLGITSNDIKLSNRAGFSPENMLEAEQIDVQLKLLPLISKQFEVGKIKLSTPKIFLALNDQGQSNWGDLTQADSATTTSASAGKDAGAALGGLIIQGVDIENADIIWSDQSNGSGIEYQLKHFNLSTSEIKSGQAIDFDLSSDVIAPELPEMASIKLSGAVNISAEQDALGLNDLIINFKMGETIADLNIATLAADLNAGDFVLDALNGKLNMDLVSTEMALDGLEFSSKKNQLKLKTANISGDYDAIPFEGVFENGFFDINQNTLNIAKQSVTSTFMNLPMALSANEIDFDIAKGQLNMPDIVLNIDDQSLAVNLTVDDLFADLKASGHIESNVLKPKALLAKLGLNVLDDLPKQALQSLKLKSDFKAGLDSMALSQLVLKVDDSNIKGRFSMPSFSKMAYRFDLNIDKLNVDQYLSSDQQASADSAGPGAAVALPFAALKGLDVQGKLGIDDLVLSDLHSEKVIVDVDTSKDQIKIAPLKANLFGGVATNDLLYDISGKSPKLNIRSDLSGLDMGNFLSAFKVTDKLQGIGDVHSKLSSQGVTVDEVISNLNGKINISLKDGAIRGANIQKSMLKVAEVYSSLKGEKLGIESEVGDQTNFSAFSSELSVKNGVLSTSDINLKAPGIRVEGGGTVNLNNSTIDLDLIVAIVGSFEGQGGEAAGKLKGEKIPVKISGDLASPSILPDFKQILLRQAERKLSEKYLGGQKLSGDAFKDKLKDKLNNKLAERLGLPAATKVELVAPDASEAQNQAMDKQKESATPEPQQDPKEALKQRLKDEKKKLKEKLLKNLFGG